jgi:hypothetical protein
VGPVLPVGPVTFEAGPVGPVGPLGPCGPVGPLKTIPGAGTILILSDVSVWLMTLIVGASATMVLTTTSILFTGTTFTTLAGFVVAITSTVPAGVLVTLSVDIKDYRLRQEER